MSSGGATVGLYYSGGLTLGLNQLNFGSSATGTDVVVRRGGRRCYAVGHGRQRGRRQSDLKAHDGITGTDILGASLTLAPGKGTGAAVSGGVLSIVT